MSQQRDIRHARHAVTAVVVSSMLPAAGHAATAARVDFAIGDVTGVDKAGKERALSKGALVREGDTIRTTRGRAQLRFTDGSRTALLPNTEFRVNEYQFAGQEDENARSFFSLVKGGLRTITGAIGKLRNRSYKLSTPVATIGIRGTEYLIVLGNSGDLRVGAGEVVASNDAGEFFCSGFCYVPNDQSPMRQVEDQPIYLAPPLTRPRGPEDPGSSGDASTLAGNDVTQSDPNGSVSPGRDPVSGGGPDPDPDPDPGPGPDPDTGLKSGEHYTLAVAYGDDTGGLGDTLFLRGESALVDVTFNESNGMERFVDGFVSATRDGATLTEVGTAGTAEGARVGWSRWTGPGSYVATGESNDNPYGLQSCSSPCDVTARGLSNGGSHHQVAIIPPTDTEALTDNTLYVFSLAGFTTPTTVQSPNTVPGVDAVSEGTLTVVSNINQVNITGMKVTANNGSLDYLVNADGLSLDPSKNYTFSGDGNFAVDLNSGSGFAAHTYIKGGLSTGFTHAGAAYKIEFGDGDHIVGTTAWKQEGQVPQ